MNFSRRTEWPAEPSPFSKLYEERKRSGRILDLTVSDPTRCEFSYARAGLLKPLSAAAVLSYAPHPQGAAAARQAVARYYASKRTSVDPADILLTASTSDAYTYLFRLLCDPGDRIGVPTPGYPLFGQLSELSDVVTVAYPLVYDAGWSLGSGALSALDGVKAVLVVHPNNPTGHYTRAAERRELLAFCARSGAALIADEVFHDYSWTGKPQPSFAAETSALTFTLSGISKVLGLPQMKLSWIVVSGPKKLKLEAMRRLQIIADAHLSVSAPVQHALVSWLPARGRAVREIRRRVTGNYRRLERAAMKRGGPRPLKADAGWYAMLELPNGDTGQEAALRLLSKHRTAVHPGYFYDIEKDDKIVLSLLAPPAVFGPAADRIALDLSSSA